MFFYFKNKNINSDFVFSEEQFLDFQKYISSHDYTYVTKTEESLEKWKKNAINENYFEDLQAEYDILSNQLKNKKQDDLFKNRDKVKEILTAEILSRYYYQKGRIKGGLNFDPEFNKAVEILENEKEYNIALQKDSLNLEFEQK